MLWSNGALLLRIPTVEAHSYLHKCIRIPAALTAGPNESYSQPQFTKQFIQSLLLAGL
ncbi:hypothetical protein Lbir_1590 [Legionella birminghamensis]|uniref:Uncharacterized protein n=1 Tax=Legionella birminghamensis TaxID=28083 RepID=A0A378IB16_9GAMM|nr:hypothetical protein Lbir_1590 [Legionella birminghamensis]STX32428.1 Uncharacterised protein [Legionella birminghamensis]